MHVPQEVSKNQYACKKGDNNSRTRHSRKYAPLINWVKHSGMVLKPAIPCNP